MSNENLKKIESIFKKHQDTIQKLTSLIPQINEVASLIKKTVHSGGKVLIFGNGGSGVSSGQSPDAATCPAPGAAALTRAALRCTALRRQLEAGRVWHGCAVGVCGRDLRSWGQLQGAPPAL